MVEESIGLAGGTQREAETLSMPEVRPEGGRAIPSFEVLYATEAGKMKSIAFNILGSRSEAEDAVQESFLKVFRSASTYDPRVPFRSWLYRIVVNSCYDILRRRRRRPEEPLEAVVGRKEERLPADDAGLRLMLRKLVEKLPEQKRSVLLLFEVEGFSHAEIAEILEIGESYSKWLLFRTKRDLQKAWSEGVA